jgi:alpha-N-acetylglucosamine transferase
MESRGIIMFNRGEKIVVRALVSLYSLRKHWDGPITFYVENPYPKEFDEVLKYFNCTIIHNEERPDYKTLVRKNSLFENPPYDRTLWVDADVIVNGKIDKMFDYLDDYDFAIPHFAGWISSGNSLTKRINKFKGIASDHHIKEALNEIKDIKELDQYYLFHATLGEFYTRLNRISDAKEQYKKALKLISSPAEKKLIKQKMLVVK